MARAGMWGAVVHLRGEDCHNSLDKIFGRHDPERHRVVYKASVYTKFSLPLVC